MRRAPAGDRGDVAQAILPIEAIDLIDDAVDIVGQISALALDMVVIIQKLGGRSADLDQRIGGEPPIREAFQNAELRIAGRSPTAPKPWAKNARDASP